MTGKNYTLKFKPPPKEMKSWDVSEFAACEISLLSSRTNKTSPSIKTFAGNAALLTIIDAFCLRTFCDKHFGIV